MAIKRNTAAKASLLALLAVLLWSTCPTAFKLGLRHQDSFQLLTLASFSSLVVLGVLLIPGKRYRQLATFSRKDLALSALLGLMNPVAYYLVLFRAYDLLPAQIAQPLNMVWPIILALISIPLLGQRIPLNRLAAMGISFSGILVISLQGGQSEGGAANRLGIFLALASSIIWAMYFIYNARDGKDPVVRLFLNFLFASVALVIIILISQPEFNWNYKALGTAVYVGIFEMGIPFVLWLSAMQLSKSNDRIGNLVFIAPFLSLFIVNRVLHESIYLTTVPGIILLVSGFLLQNRIQRHAKR